LCERNARGDRSAGLASRDRLSKYSVSAEEYLAWTGVVQDGAPASYEIADVRVTGTDRVNPDYVLLKLEHARPGAELGIDEVVADTEKLYALGDFEHINYRLGGTPDAQVLTIDVTEKSWGPNFIAFDYGLAMQGGGQIFAVRTYADRFFPAVAWLRRRRQPATAIYTGQARARRFDAGRPELAIGECASRSH
jgi:NTE family protein